MVYLDNGATNVIVGQGVAGSITQNNGSTVTTGPGLYIGDGSTGTYTVNTGAVLNIGDQVTPNSASYVVEVGSLTGSTGTLTLNGTMNAMNNSTEIFIGGGGGTGTLNQNATVNLGGSDSFIVVDTNGTYNLNPER